MAKLSSKKYLRWMAVPSLVITLTATAQFAPLAPKWLAGTPSPPVETFADGLTRHNIPLTEPDLLGALKNSDPEIRSLAAAELAAIEQLKTICRDVNQPSTARLDAARYISNKQLSDCFPAVREIARNDQDANARALAVTTAINYRGQSDGAEKIAVQALNDIDPTVRVTAIDALRSLRATDAIPALQNSLQSEGDEIAREHLRETLRVLQLAADRDKKEREKANSRQ